MAERKGFEPLTRLWRALASNELGLPMPNLSMVGPVGVEPTESLVSETSAFANLTTARC